MSKPNLTKFSRYHQGRFRPQNPNKYMGDPQNIIFRSGYERKFMGWCDLNSSVIHWGSELITIPYISPLDGNFHRYFPDFIVEVQDNEKSTRKILIEIKPKSQTSPPKRRRNIKTFFEESKTFAVNKAKWEAAEKWAKNNNLEFMILTEVELGIGNG